MSVLVIAEHDNQALKQSTLSVIQAATLLGDKIDVLVIGFECQSVVESLKKSMGITRIIVNDDEQWQYPLAESFAPLISELANDYSHILVSSTTFGKNILPRAAALLNMGMLSDVIEIIDEKTYRRPMYAGNVIAKVVSSDSIQLLTVRATAFTAVEQNNDDSQVEVIEHTFSADNRLSKFVKHQLAHADRPELSSADIVISGGRGLQNKENFQRLTLIADRLGAAIGASRAAVDAGLASNDLQVGQTGQMVAPKLYIAVGISGAIQHLAGMKDSKIIVAINKDPDAPIFQIADYGLVADLLEVLPQWEKTLTEMGY